MPFLLVSENVGLARAVEGFLLKNERCLTIMAADLDKVFALGDNTLLSVKECAALLDVGMATMRKIAVDNNLRIIKMSSGKVAAHKICASDLKRYVSDLLGLPK